MVTLHIQQKVNKYMKKYESILKLSEMKIRHLIGEVFNLKNENSTLEKCLIDQLLRVKKFENLGFTCFNFKFQVENKIDYQKSIEKKEIEISKLRTENSLLKSQINIFEEKLKKQDKDLCNITPSKSAITNKQGIGGLQINPISYSSQLNPIKPLNQVNPLNQIGQSIQNLDNNKEGLKNIITTPNENKKNKKAENKPNIKILNLKNIINPMNSQSNYQTIQPPSKVSSNNLNKNIHTMQKNTKDKQSISNLKSFTSSNDSVKTFPSPK